MLESHWFYYIKRRRQTFLAAAVLICGTIYVIGLALEWFIEIKVAEAQRKFSRLERRMSHGLSRPPDHFAFEHHEARLNLKEIWSAHRDFWATKWEQFLDVYEAEFSRIRESKKFVTLLEIGIANGGSLQIWKKYFGANSKIIGLDIHPGSCGLKFSLGIETFCISATNRDGVDEVLKDMKFDIIIDDGSHVNSEVIETFLIFFPSRLNRGGTYIIEDTQTSYYPKYGGGLRRRDTTMEYFKEMLDYLNLYHIVGEFSAYPDNITPQKDEFAAWVECAMFHENLIVLRTRTAPKLQTHEIVVTGRTAKVWPNWPADFDVRMANMQFALRNVSRTKLAKLDFALNHSASTVIAGRN